MVTSLPDISLPETLAGGGARTKPGCGRSDDIGDCHHAAGVEVDLRTG